MIAGRDLWKFAGWCWLNGFAAAVLTLNLFVVDVPNRLVALALGVFVVQCIQFARTSRRTP